MMGAIQFRLQPCAPWIHRGRYAPGSPRCTSVVWNTKTNKNNAWINKEVDNQT